MSSILIIEDDPALLEIYRIKFQFEKFTVVTASGGQDGIDKMKSVSPDIILLDLFMSKVSGFDVLKAVKSDTVLNKIPILVLTNISVDVEDLLKNWGARDFLLKADSTPDDVVDKVNKLLSANPDPGTIRN